MAEHLEEKFVRDEVTSVSWADTELKTYRLVDLQPGESRVVSIELAVADCTLVDANATRLVEPRTFCEASTNPPRRDDASCGYPGAITATGVNSVGRRVRRRSLRMPPPLPRR
ncbi:MAG: fibronectin type III-like domain-contianing protein [Rhodoglobus sp.]